MVLRQGVLCCSQQNIPGKESRSIFPRLNKATWLQRVLDQQATIRENSRGGKHSHSSSAASWSLAAIFHSTVWTLDSHHLSKQIAEMSYGPFKMFLGMLYAYRSCEFLGFLSSPE